MNLISWPPNSSSCLTRSASSAKRSHQPRQAKPLQDLCEIGLGDFDLRRDFVRGRELPGSLLGEKDQSLNGYLGSTLKEHPRPHFNQDQPVLIPY